jgi:nicotinamide-nucleotide amidase
MNAELISIGTELLLGQIVNTNAAYLGQRLAALGIDVYRQTTVGDNPGRLAEAVRNALSRSDLVVLTGGLGPTVDDVTTATVASLTGRRLVLDKGALQDLKAYFASYRRKMPRGNERQAYVPEGARVMRNRVGTAPGLVIEDRGKVIVCLPGPPRELCPMFEKAVAPYLKGRFRTGCVLVTRTIKTVGIPEAKVNGIVKDLLELAPPTTVGIYAKLREVHLAIMAKAPTAASAGRAIAPIERRIRARLKGYIFGYDDDTLEGAVASLLIKGKKTIAVAESCTGGLISSRLTDTSGSSGYFIRGAVPYSNDVKVKYLGVSEDSLKRHGAVSAQVAVQMARNIRSLMVVDLGLGVTGIAGPTGGTGKKPVGLVYIALSSRRKETVREFRFRGSRQDVKWQTSQAALDMVRKEVNLKFKKKNLK